MLRSIKSHSSCFSSAINLSLTVICTERIDACGMTSAVYVSDQTDIRTRTELGFKSTQQAGRKAEGNPWNLPVIFTVFFSVL
jgi:hypothetical protein